MAFISAKTKERMERNENRYDSVSKEEWKEFFQNEKVKSEQSVNKSSFEGTYVPKEGTELSTYGSALNPTDAMLEEQKTKEEVNSEIKDLFESQEMNATKEKKQKKLVNKSLETEIAVKESKKGNSKKSKSTGPIMAKSTNTGNQKAKNANPASAKSQTLEMGNAKAQTIDVPKSWSTNSAAKSQSVEVSTLLQQSMVKEQHINSAWEDINENQRKGKKLMQVFYHLMKMAESGDLSAIRNFITFIAYVTQKDTANQVIQGGKNYIKLQAMQREWNEKLYNLSGDTDSTELLKTTTLVKSETDAIAAAQRQLTQMLESSLQQIESLANVQKGVSDTVGRVMRRLSNFSA